MNPLGDMHKKNCVCCQRHEAQIKDMKKEWERKQIQYTSLISTMGIVKNQLTRQVSSLANWLYILS